jgi:hypothetical protein
LQLFSLLTIAATGLAGCKPKPASIQNATSTPVSVIVRIAGGNAIVYTGGGTGAVVGPVMAPDPTMAGDFNDHDMDVVLDEGIPDTSSAFAPAEAVAPINGASLPLWRAKGFDIQLCEDGNCTDDNKMDKPVTTAPSPACQDGEISDGSMYYVPNLSALHPGSTVVSNWRDRLGTRLRLQHGKLVTNRIVQCFEFRDAQGKIQRKDSIADGHDGVMNKFTSNAQFIDVVFSKNGQPVKTVRLTPEDGKIEISLYPTGHPVNLPDDELKPGDTVKRFAPFYDLLDPTSFNGRFTLNFSPTPAAKPQGINVNPGGECPPASVDAQ